ncbi:hypothetical protein GGR54DRAFT_634910 [Hypoxylon sp. NC1633]|nr:hypothetical protein GGR54DRAFT_634910 [Hypoxylon sp. NC1633]
MAPSMKPGENMLWGARFTGKSWEVMLDPVKTVSDSIQIATGVLATLDIKPLKIKAALDPFLLATDIADYLLKSIDSCFEEDIANYFDYERSVEMRSAKGGTSNESVLEQIKVMRQMLDA